MINYFNSTVFHVIIFVFEISRYKTKYLFKKFNAYNSII